MVEFAVHTFVDLAPPLFAHCRARPLRNVEFQRGVDEKVCPRKLGLKHRNNGATAVLGPDSARAPAGATSKKRPPRRTCPADLHTRAAAAAAAIATVNVSLIAAERTPDDVMRRTSGAGKVPLQRDPQATRPVVLATSLTAKPGAAPAPLANGMNPNDDQRFRVFGLWWTLLRRDRTPCRSGTRRLRPVLLRAPLRAGESVIKPRYAYLRLTLRSILPIHAVCVRRIQISRM